MTPSAIEIKGAKRYPSPLSRMAPLMDDQINTPQFMAMKTEAVQCRINVLGLNIVSWMKCREIKIKTLIMIVDNIIL